MHEMGLTRRLVKLVEDEAQARELTQIKRVRLELGVLAGIEDEALRFNFRAAARGTVAQDAELDIVSCPDRAWCPQCRAEVVVANRDQACPVCNTMPLTPLEPEAVRITELVAT